MCFECNFLNLYKVVQVSLAEYTKHIYSKQNFVERCHPRTNKALSGHRAFFQATLYTQMWEGLVNQST